MPIVEAGLTNWWPAAWRRALSRFTASAVEAVAGAEFVFLCVPTPQGADGSADLSYVESAAKEIGAPPRAGAIVVNKSTVPVGSATMVEQVIGRSGHPGGVQPRVPARGHGGRATACTPTASWSGRPTPRRLPWWASSSPAPARRSS